MFENKLITVLAISMFFGALIELSKGVPQEVTCTTTNRKYCYNCQSYLTCYTVAGTMKNTTTACQTPTQGCLEDTSSASCTSSPPECSCTGTGLSYKPDPYNIHFYIVCNGATPVYIDCKDKIYDAKTNKCVTPPPPPTCPGSGIFEDTDTATCDGFIICSSAGATPTIGKCQTSPNLYFNPTTTNCEPSPSLFKCTKPTFEIEKDPYDCRRYYVCDGVDLIDFGCCGLDQRFDDDIDDCVKGSCTSVPPPAAECL